MQDGSLQTANQIQLSSLAILATQQVQAIGGNDQIVVGQVIPAGACVMGVTTQNLVDLNPALGLTSFYIGDRAVIDRWGTQRVLSNGAQTSMSNFSPGAWPIYPATSDVLLTAQGGPFTSAARIEISVWYFTLTHRAQS